MKIANNIKREYKIIHDYWHFPVFELNFKRWKLPDGFAAQKVSRNSILKPYIPIFLWFTQISRKTAHNTKTQYLYSLYLIFIEFMRGYSG